MVRWQLDRASLLLLSKINTSPKTLEAQSQLLSEIVISQVVPLWGDFMAEATLPCTAALFTVQWGAFMKKRKKPVKQGPKKRKSKPKEQKPVNGNLAQGPGLFRAP